MRVDKQTMILAKFGKETAARVLRIFFGLGQNESIPILIGNIPLLLVKIMRKIDYNIGCMRRALTMMWRGSSTVD